MSYPQSKVPNMRHVPPPPLPPSDRPNQATGERKQIDCDKNSEIEKIKRQLHNLIDRVDALKTK